MAIQFTEFKSPKGHDLVRITSQNDSVADAAELSRVFSPGGPSHGRAMLFVTDPNMQLSPDARRAYADMRRSVSVLSAMVVQSAASRVAINFIIRAADALKKSEKDAKCFGTEAAALAWLDENLSAAT